VAGLHPTLQEPDHSGSGGKFLFLVVSYLERKVKGIAPLYHVCITSDILILLAWKANLFVSFGKHSKTFPVFSVLTGESQAPKAARPHLESGETYVKSAPCYSFLGVTIISVSTV
jgi:hypothetical protein